MTTVEIKDIIRNIVGYDCNVFVTSFEDSTSIIIASMSGIFIFRLSIYNSTPSTMFVSEIAVSEKHRESGYGKLILNFINNIAIELGIKIISLVVSKDTFMQAWYNRNGYVDYFVHESDTKYITLIKVLNK